MRLLLLLLLLCAPAFAQAQVSASVENPHLSVGASTVLSITVSGSVAGIGEPRIPDIPGFHVRNAGVSNSMSIINGRTSSTSTFAYMLTALRPGSHLIPPIQVEVEGQTYETPAIQIEVAGGGSPPTAPAAPPGSSPPALPWGGPPGMSPTRPPAGPSVFVEAEISDATPYVNEPVIYTFRLFHSTNLSDVHYEPPEATGFLREDLKQRTFEADRNGTKYSVSEARLVLFPTSAGRFTIGPTRLSCRVVPDDPFADPFMLADPVKELVSESITVDVQPLPAQGRPVDFSGGVGRYTLEAQFVTNRGKQGEPLTLLATVEGNGHPDLLSDLSLPPNDDFKIYKAESKSTLFKDEHFKGRRLYKIPVVPMKAGKLTLPPVRLSYFDPDERQYRVAESQPLTVEVAPGRVPVPQVSGTPLENAEIGLRGPHAPDAAGKPSGWEKSRFFWLAQLAPWALAVLWVFARSLHAQWMAGSAERLQSDAIRKARRALRRNPDADGLGRILLGYLETKTGAGFSGYTHTQLSRRLQDFAITPATAEETSRLLSELEAWRYAPAEARASQPELQRTAQSVLEKLHQEIERRA